MSIKKELRPAFAGVIAFRYVGLPLAMVYVAAGYRFLGFNTDPVKVEKLNAGEGADDRR